MRASQEQTTVLIADPPWPHANGSRTNSGKSPKYPLMNICEICDLGTCVRSIVGDHAVLYLWATGPHLPGAFDVMRAWGFAHRSFHVWRKPNIAAGFWARSDAEICLIAVRGRPCAPRASLLPRTVIDGERKEARHSSKPDDIHEIAERLWPAARKVELFARSIRPGWDAIGHEVGKTVTPLGVNAA